LQCCENLSQIKIFAKAFGFPYFVSSVQQKSKIYYFYHYVINYRNSRYFFRQWVFKFWQCQGMLKWEALKNFTIPVKMLNKNISNQQEFL